MTREELLVTFSYPPFQESARHFCLKIVKISSTSVHFHQGPARKLTKKTNFEFASVAGPEACVHFEPGDWVAVKLDSRNQIKSLKLLAPRISNWKPPEVSVTVLRDWNLFLKTVRNFFENRDFLEVQTPTLVACPGTEPFLDVFKTEFQRGPRDTRQFYLPTSPELHLKKLVAAGYGPLFEIRPCFRNGEISPHHQPEFWMLEWYRPGQNLEIIKRDCEALIRCVAKAFKRAAPKNAKQVTMQQLFERHLNFELTPRTTAEDLRSLAARWGVHMNPESDFDDAFYLLFLEKVEPHLSSSQQPVFVSGYPPSQAALARITEDGWGDRFELYWREMELANAYHELNDPKIQRERSREDLAKKAALARETVNLDEDFFQSLEAGLPPTAGIALGLERLFLAVTGRRSLEELRLFPLKTL